MNNDEIRRMIDEFEQVPRPKIDQKFQLTGTMKEVANLIKKWGPDDIYLRDYNITISEGRKVSSVRSFVNYRLGVFVINKDSSTESYLQDMAVSEEDAKKIYDGVLLAITRNKITTKSQIKKSIHKFERRIKELDKELEDLKKLKRQ